MWSKPHFCVFLKQADEEQKPVDPLRLRIPPQVMVIVTTLVFFYNEVLVSDIFMETAVVGLGLLG